MRPQISALFGLAVQAFQQGDAARAEHVLVDLLGQQPRHVDALKLLGYLRGLAGQPGEAAALLERALRLQPTDANVLVNLGRALSELGRHAEALLRFRRAVAVQPDSFSAWFGLAASAGALGLQQEAHASYSRALALDTGSAKAWCNRAHALAALRRFEEALADYDAALRADAQLATAWAGRAATLMDLGRHDEASRDYERALALDPTLPYIDGQAVHVKMLGCEWDGLEARIDRLRAGLAKGLPVADPFGFQAMSHSEPELHACATRYAADTFPPVPLALPRHREAADGRIRVGYLCGEFRDQATSVLMAGLYEAHDRTRFTLHAFDSGWDDGSALRQRIDRAFDHRVPIASLGDDAAALAVREAGIDILVNLNGYFGQVRQGVFARRAAPLQVNFLGFPGTLGAPYMDYLIADAIVIPEASRDHYTEKIVHLPGCYQPNDARRAISPEPRERAALGLPDRGFVFACFNNNYKITPAMFDRWMRILLEVDGSVLWLLQDNPWAERNLRAEATRRGIDGTRLVFAQREPLPDHLARHQAADLFLDTAPYNAHTTASDALWAGLPLLTLRGSTFPGRVAESLLDAVGLRELVAPDADSYERMAIALAREPHRLVAIRQSLVAGRASARLFDPARFARGLEAAYHAMVERQRRGLAPDHLVIAEPD